MRSRAVVLDSLPAVERIVKVIDNFMTNRRLAMIFEARVGAGSLLFSAADLTTELETRHAARQMRRSVIAYMQSSDFAPKAAITPAQLTSMVGGKPSKPSGRGDTPQ